MKNHKMPISMTMKTIEELYALYSKLFGPNMAKGALADAIWVVISRIEEECLTVTQEVINQRLEIIKKDFSQASKNSVA